MPDLSKLFAKRLDETNYNNILTFLNGKTKFNDLEKGSQKVLKGMEKPPLDRTFTEQSQLYELKQKLIINKWIAPDSDAWDKFENGYRTFILGEAARAKFWDLRKQLEHGDSYMPIQEEQELSDAQKRWNDKIEADFEEDYNDGNLDEFKGKPLDVMKQDYKDSYLEWLNDSSITSEMALKYRKEMGIKPGDIQLTELPSTRALAVDKWNKRAIENFWDDKEELPGFEEEYRGMSLEEQKLEYKKDFFSWLEDPENTMGMAAEYRRDLGGATLSICIKMYHLAKYHLLLHLTLIKQNLY